MEIIMEKVKNSERFFQKIPDKIMIDNAIDMVLKKNDLLMSRLKNNFPFSSSLEKKYQVVDNTEWSAGFWTGMLWLAYEQTQNEKYRCLAESHVQSFKKRIELNEKNVQHHDVGFLYTLSCVAAYKLTHCSIAKKTAILAADRLISRYHEKAGIIQAWGDLGDPEQQGGMIIGCNMNLPLLYWASSVTNNRQYTNIACRHIKNVQKYIIKSDASTYHTFYMDVETGAPKFGKTLTEKSDNSCWARGQAWAIYGFLLSYHHTRDNSLIELSKKLINYFLNRLSFDFIPCWDLAITNNCAEPQDSSAAAILVCGLLEIIKHLPVADPDRDLYKYAACSLMKSLTESYTSHNPNEDGILTHATDSLPKGTGIDEFCIWGDYFYFEALTRMSKTWNMYW